MVRTKHSIQLPERLVAPGELLTLDDPADEARLIALGAAEAVEPFPQGETEPPASRPHDPSDPPDDPQQAPKGRRK